MSAKLDSAKQNRIIKRNAIASIVFKGLEYFLAFFTTPVLLYILGEYKYGVYTTALSIISWIYYFDLGIGSGVRNSVAEAIAVEDHDTAQKCISVAYVLVSCISIVAFIAILGFLFVFDVDKLLNARLLDENLNTIIVVASFFACLNFVFTLSTNVLFSLQKSGFVSGLGIFSKLLLVMLLLLIKSSGNKLMIVVVALEGLVQLIKNIFAFGCVFILDKRLTPKLRNIDFKYSKKILSFGIQIFIMQISALILNATDNIIIMKLFGAEDVTPYSMCHKFFSIINAFYAAAIGPLWTAFTNAYVLKEVEYIKCTLKKALSLYVLTLMGIIGSFFIFKPFMRIYLGQELVYPRGIVVLVGVYYAILIFSHNFSSFVHGIGKVKLTTIACVISAVINIPVSVLLAKYYGMELNGIIGGSIVSLIVTTIAYVYTTIKELKRLEKC